MSQFQTAASGAVLAGATFGLCSSIRRMSHRSNPPTIFLGRYMTAQAGREVRLI
jgi:hypothetical protein